MHFIVSGFGDMAKTMPFDNERSVFAEKPYGRIVLLISVAMCKRLGKPISHNVEEFLVHVERRQTQGSQQFW